MKAHFLMRGGDHDGAPLAWWDDERIIIAQYVASKDGHATTKATVQATTPEAVALLAGWSHTPVDGNLLACILEALTPRA